jgi:RNA polymerase sigma factor (sigma-70 family)
MTDIGLVLFGVVVESRRDRVGSTAWLRDLVAELDSVYSDLRLAPFGFSQGDVLLGLLESEADPFAAILRASLGPGGRRMRWVVARGEVDPDPTEGRAPAPERTGQAFVTAREAMDAARTGHARLAILTGDAAADLLLADFAPVLVDMLDGLTERQRTVARLALIDDLRQSEVADRLKIRRATVSVAFSRARIRSLQRFVAGMRLVYAGAAAVDRPSTAPGAGGPSSV